MAKEKNSCQALVWDSLLAKLYFGMMFFAVWLVPFSYSLELSELFEFPKMLLVYLIAALSTSIWASRMIISKKLLLPQSWLDLPILFFLLSQILATATSIHQYTSIFGYYSRFHGGLASVFAYSLIYFSFGGSLRKVAEISDEGGRRIVKYFLISLIVSLIFLSLYAIPEKFGYAFSCLRATGEFSTECWKEDTNPKYRIFGSFGQPNWLAAYLIMIIPIGLTFAITPTPRTFFDKTVRYLAVIGVILGTIAVWLTGSRSGLLGLLAAGAVLSFGWGIKAYSQNKIAQSTKIPIITAAVLLLALGTVLGWRWWEKSQDIQPSLAGSDSGAIRRVVWAGAWQIWLAHPWLGTGPETFGYSYYRFRPIAHNLLSEWDFLYNKAHNEWLNLLANSGIVGFTGFIAIRLATIRLIWAKTNKRDSLFVPSSETNSWLMAILAGIVALEVSNFFGFSTVSVTFVEYLLFGILAVMTNSSNDNPHQSKLIKSRIGQSWLPLSNPVGMLLIIALGWGLSRVVNTVYSIYSADLKYVRGKTTITSDFEQGQSLLAGALGARPQEALYFDTLAEQYSLFAQSLWSSQDQEQMAVAKQLGEKAVETNQRALDLNPHHLNFYKTRVRILSRIYQFYPQALEKAEASLALARELAPTDPKLIYNQAKILQYLERSSEAIELLQLALVLKPNYPEPRFELAQIMMQQQNWVEAQKHYQYIIDSLNPTDPVATEALNKIQQLMIK